MSWKRKNATEAETVTEDQGNWDEVAFGQREEITRVEEGVQGQMQWPVSQTQWRVSFRLVRTRRDSQLMDH